MSLMNSKDFEYNEKRGKHSSIEEVANEDEDHEIGSQENFTTLRISAAFTIERFSSKIHPIVNYFRNIPR